MRDCFVPWVALNAELEIVIPYFRSSACPNFTSYYVVVVPFSITKHFQHAKKFWARDANTKLLNFSNGIPDASVVSRLMLWYWRVDWRKNVVGSTKGGEVGFDTRTGGFYGFDEDKTVLVRDYHGSTV